MMKAAFLHGLKDIRIQDLEVPEPRDDEVLIKIAANGICGSDVHFYLEGKLGPFVVDRPYIPGHEASGTIEKVGTEVRNVAPGDRVVLEPGIPCRRCRLCKQGRYNLCPDVVFLSAPPVNGTFAQYVAVPWDFVYPIPDSLEFEQAALIEPAAVGVHAANRAGITAGMSVTILGLGPIGLIALQCARAFGATDIVAVDIEPSRLEFAQSLGATTVIDARREDTVQAVRRAAKGEGTDVVLETAGSVTTTQQTVQVAGRGGVVVQVGWPEDNVLPYDIAAVMEKELDIRGLNRYANAYAQAIDLTASGRLDLRSLITHRFPFEQVADAFAFVSRRESGVIKTVVAS
jgi:L-iditol 2-dehydrogenase